MYRARTCDPWSAAVCSAGDLIDSALGAQASVSRMSLFSTAPPSFQAQKPQIRPRAQEEYSVVNRCNCTDIKQAAVNPGRSPHSILKAKNGTSRRGSYSLDHCWARTGSCCRASASGNCHDCARNRPNPRISLDELQDRDMVCVRVIYVTAGRIFQNYSLRPRHLSSRTSLPTCNARYPGNHSRILTEGHTLL